MKKLLISATAAAMLAAIAPTTNAAVGSAGFTVSATLTSACTVGAIGNLAFAPVTAFVAPANATTTALVSCTRSLAPIVTAVFDTTNGTASAAAATPTGAGVLSNGLNYSLATARSAVTAGTAATSAAGVIGTADTFTYTITGSMAAQAGTCAAATCASAAHVRTITLNF